MTNQVDIVVDHLSAHIARLQVLDSYLEIISEPHVAPYLERLVDSTQDVIAHSSRQLRRLDEPFPDKRIAQLMGRLLNQALDRKALLEQLDFVEQGLVHQQTWYQTQLATLPADSELHVLFTKLATELEEDLANWMELTNLMKGNRKTHV